ncbi:MAG: RNA-guided endonuclease InsQ/TnpB family protein [Ktedonobacteraceae bacterium]
MRTFEYRIYPNQEQSRLLMACLSESRHLYNEMLAASKEHYEQTGKFLLKYELTARFRGRGGAHVPASTVQMVADRLDKAFKRCFARRELGEPGGFPRWKSPNRWHSIQLRQHQTDFSLAPDGKHLHIPKKLGGSLKMKVHRPLEGTPKTAHLVLRADGHWYALIVCETQPQQEHAPSTCQHPDIGLDVGLQSFLMDSEGHSVENPRYYRKSHKTLRRKQRTIARRTKGSKRRGIASKIAAHTHLKIKRQRRDFHFKVAKQYTEQYHHIAVENLNIEGMVKNHHLAKSIMDASWGAFLDILEAKAESAGHQVIRVNPRYTSQTCSQCGEIVQKSLSVRTHLCPCCGYVADRDVNAAKNILAVARPGHGLQELTYTSGCSVS